MGIWTQSTIVTFHPTKFVMNANPTGFAFLYNLLESIMKCNPGSKQRGKVLFNPCFQCIRKTNYVEKYEFSWECAYEVLLKMNKSELEEISNIIIQSIVDNYCCDCDDDELILLGDCYARVYLHLLTRGNYLRESYEKYQVIRMTVLEAANKSMPSWGLYMIIERKSISMPECWLRMNCNFI